MPLFAFFICVSFLFRFHFAKRCSYPELTLQREKKKRGMRDMYVVPPPPDPIAGATVDASVTGDDGEDQLRTYQAWKGSNVS
jgi:hypothetical protein